MYYYVVYYYIIMYYLYIAAFCREYRLACGRPSLLCRLLSLHYVGQYSVRFRKADM